MSDKPTEKPKPGRSTGAKRKLTKAAHEKPNYGGQVKDKGKGYTVPKIPAKGAECNLQKFNAKQEAKFNNRGATQNWNRKRPHIAVDTSKNDPMRVPEPSTPSKVQPPECKKSYGGLSIGM